MEVTHWYYYVDVSVSSQDIDLMESAHKFIREKLELRNPEVQEYDKERTKNLQPTVFIGRHFDDLANDYCNTLSRFGLHP